jgi:hypothetical protein
MAAKQREVEGDKEFIEKEKTRLQEVCAIFIQIFICDC